MPTITKSLISAAALVAATASSASAAIVSFLNQDIAIPSTYAGVSVNLETAAASIALSGEPGANANFVLGGKGISNDADQTALTPTWQPVRAGTGNTDAILNLDAGSIIGPASAFSTDFGGSIDHFGTPETFTSGERGYIGYSVELADSTLAYGWAEVTLQDDNTPGVIHSWAFQDDGSPIAVATVPEPTSSLLLTLGLVATAMLRRRVA